MLAPASDRLNAGVAKAPSRRRALRSRFETFYKVEVTKWTGAFQKGGYTTRLKTSFTIDV